MTKGLVFLGVFVLALGALPGCSSSSDGNAATECTAATPCGGDLSGTWKVAAACLSDAEKASLEDSLKVCPTGSASVSSLSTSGTVTFDAGALKEDVTATLHLTNTVPTSCLNGATCASLQAQLAAQTSAGVSDVACHSSADSCTCTYVQTVNVKQESSFTTSDSTITETDASDGSVTTAEYCVAGNKLTEKDDDGSISVYTR